MSQPAEPADAGRPQPRTAWQSFRAWRRTRPFWGGVTAILAAIEMYGVTAAPFHVVLIQGVAGISAIVIAICFVLLAVLTWFQPHVRVATGLMIVVLSLASILLTNLGGFLIGMLLGLHSGSSITAWRPRPAQRRRPDRTPRAGGSPLLSWFPGRGPGQTTPEPVGPGGEGRAAGPDGGTDTADASDSPTQDDPAVGDPAGHDPARQESGGRIRRGRLSGPQSYLSVALLATVAMVPGARAPATTSDSLLCSILPVLCPSSSSTQTAATPTPTASPTAGPSASPTVNPSASPTTPPSPSDSAPSAQPPATAPTPSPSSSTPAASTAPACDASGLPTGRIALGGAAARHAAAVMRACLTAQRSGAITGAATSRTRAQAFAAGGPPRAAGRSTHIRADEETMQGLSYHGIATLDTVSGPLRTLDFTASSVTITAMREDVGPMNLGGSTMTLGGDVHLYVVSLSGKVFGLLPLTISPGAPPPLVLPSMVFTDVDSQIAYIDAGSLNAPAAQIAVG